MEKDIKINKKIVDTVKEVSTELFAQVGSKAKIEVKHDKDSDAVIVLLKSEEETGLLIGKRGETIESIQTVLNLIVSQKVGGWVRILVDISDWRERQEDTLKDLAVQTLERVRETGDPERLYNLTSAQRRVVHMELSKEDDIKTESEGEGRDRCLVVSLK